MVIVCGLNYAFDLSGVASYPVVGTHIGTYTFSIPYGLTKYTAYGTHPYDYSGKQPTDWPASFGYLVPNHPVIMTEFGQYHSCHSFVIYMHLFKILR